MEAYNLILSDGQKVRIEAHNAAEAIGKALRDFRGLTVSECYQGFDAQTEKLGRECIGGTYFGVPPHKAIPPDPPKATRVENNMVLRGIKP